MMKHRISERCDAKDCAFRLDRYTPTHLSASRLPEGERIEVRGFGIAACSDATLTLEKGEENRATPLQQMVSTVLVRSCNSWPHNESRT